MFRNLLSVPQQPHTLRAPTTTSLQANTSSGIASGAPPQCSTPFDLIVKHMKFASGARPAVGHGDSSKAHAPKCIASGDGVLGCVAGMSTSFTVDSRDSLNNLRSMGGDLFTARLEGKSNINVPIKSLGGGKYVCYVCDDLHSSADSTQLPPQLRPHIPTQISPHRFHLTSSSSPPPPQVRG
jgi:hypothetical protein